MVTEKDMRAMLGHCAPGHKWVLKPHNILVYYKKKTAFLPTGKHTKKNPKIEIGHVKKCARHLGILDCAKEFLGLK